MSKIKVKTSSRQVIINVHRDFAVVYPASVFVTENGLPDITDDAEFRQALEEGDVSIFDFEPFEMDCQ